MRPLFLTISLVILLACAISLQASEAAKYTLVTLLHTNDIHGRVMPTQEPGGLARVATLVREIRDQMPNVILLDAGDIIHGTPEDYLSGGKATISAMNAVGYAAATTGNHEYDFGLGVLKNASEHAVFPFVAANVRAASGGQWDRVAPYAVFEVEGVKIGVVGITTLEIMSLQWPGSIKDIVVEDPIDTARAIVPQLREQADVVVLLSHLGANQDTKLARQIPGIDFIIGGHSHTVIADWRWVGDTQIVQAGAYAGALGRIDFIVRTDETGSRIESVNGKNGSWNDLTRPPLGLKYPKSPLIPVDSSVPYDGEVERAYLQYRNVANEVLATPIGEAPVPIPGRAGRAGESAAANLVADAVRAFSGSDIAVIDTESIAAGGIPAGTITAGTAFNLINGYTRQQIVVVRMTADQLVQALNSRCARKKQVAAAVSGASVTYRIKGGAPVITTITIDGGAAEPERHYTVAAQAYIMMEMMQAVSGIQVESEPEGTVREALISHIKSLGTVNSPPTGRLVRSDAVN